MAFRISNRKKCSKTWLIGLACLTGTVASAWSWHQDHQITGSYRAFGPVGELKIRSPKIAWEVWGTSGCKVTATKMSVNGRQVAATYNPDQTRLEFLPSEPLPAGSYSVAAEVMIDGFLPMRKSWAFEVQKNAMSVLPEPSAEQVQVVQTVNHFRSEIGLPDARMDPSLCAAAQAHTRYLAMARATGHGERNDNPAFAGATIAERLNAFGFIGSAYETLGFEADGSTNGTVRDLFDAPYHRIPFLQPGNILVGAGVADKRVDIAFSSTSREGVQVSPSPGQCGVSRQWDGIESPSPLRIKGLQAPIGYPIVAAHFGNSVHHLVAAEAVVTGPSGKVACSINDPENDNHLSDAIIVIPERPLEAGKYLVRLTLIFSDGKSMPLTWEFNAGG